MLGFVQKCIKFKIRNSYIFFEFYVLTFTILTLVYDSVIFALIVICFSIGATFMQKDSYRNVAFGLGFFVLTVIVHFNSDSIEVFTTNIINTLYEFYCVIFSTLFFYDILTTFVKKEVLINVLTFLSLVSILGINYYFNSYEYINEVNYLKHNIARTVETTFKATAPIHNDTIVYWVDSEIDIYHLNKNCVSLQDSNIVNRGTLYYASAHEFKDTNCKICATFNYEV